MKIPKQRTDYLFSLYLPILVAGMLTALFLSRFFFLISTVITFVLLASALFLTLTPTGKRKLPTFKPLSAKKTGFLPLVGLQLSVYLMFLMLRQTAPAVTAPLNLMLYTSWPLCVLLAITFSYCAAGKKTAPILDLSFRPVFGNRLNSILGSGIDIFVKQALFFSCAITLSTAILLITQIFRQWFHLPDIFQPQFSHLPLSTVIILAVSTPLWRRYLYLLRQRGASLSAILIFFSLLLLCFMLGFNLILVLIAQFFPNFQPAAPAIEITLQQFFTQLLPWPLNWQLLAFAWWVGFIPLVAWIIAHIMQGKNLRTMIFSTLIIPTIMLFTEKWQFNHLGWLWQLLLAFISLAIISFLFKDKLLTSLLLSTGSGKNAGRIAFTSLQSLLFFIAVITVIYLLTGINLIILLFFSFAAVNFLFLVIAALGCINFLSKNKR